MSDGAIPLRRAVLITIDGAPVLASRISYAGELGWELYVEPRWAVSTWDRLIEAGLPHGLEIVGYRALEALRLEKGYRYFGTDLTMLDDPFEAGLGPFVRLDKGPFIGREALLARRAGRSDRAARRLATVLIGGAGYQPVYGGEAVRLAGSVVGRLRSSAWGPTVGAHDRDRLPGRRPAPGTELEVDVFSERVPADAGRRCAGRPARRADAGLSAGLSRRPRPASPRSRGRRPSPARAPSAPRPSRRSRS